MKISFGSSGGAAFDPARFLEEEVKAARANGTILEVRFSKTVNDSYLANCCGKCGVITGSFFLHDYWHLADDKAPITLTTRCPKCANFQGGIEDEFRSAPVAPLPASGDVPDPLNIAPVAKKAVREKAPTVWGKCGKCATAACPAILKSGKFFCFACRGNELFILS